jgi:hypothetical protein
MKPWPRTRTQHETGLSGLDAHDPNSGDVPFTLLAKRPADTPAEHRSQRPKMEDTSQAITGPSSASVQPPSCEAQCTMGDKPVWLGNIVWSYGGSEFDVPVQATNPIRDLYVHLLVVLLLVGDLPCPHRRTSKWPTSLRLEIVEAGMSTLNVQARMQKHKTAVARFQCPPGIVNQHFGELVETLREGNRVSGP